MKIKLILTFLLLIFVAPAMLRAETVKKDASAPVVSQQVRRSEDLGQSSTVTVTTYDQLVAAIRKARAASQGRVEAAVRQEKVRECWETGKLIDAHVLQHKERGDYGKQVIERLAKDLETSARELYYMLAYYRAYPILRAPAQLSWSHYEVLLSVSDPKERADLEEKAAKGNWSQDQLRAKIKENKAAKNETPAATPVEEKLTAQPGKVGTYKMVKATVGPEAGKLVIDLGFSNYYKTSRPLGFKEGAIIEALFAMPEGSTPSDKIKLSKRTSADLYTYRAYVHRVLDGDTIEAVIDLGFGVRSVQTLRLRGIDAPELVSKEGKEAKGELEQMINGATKGSTKGQVPRATKDGDKGEGQARGSWVVERGTEVLIKTSKSDKYDRYLADVFVGGVYVNKKLVDEGLAVRVQS